MKSGGSRSKPMTSERNQVIPSRKIPIHVEHNLGAYHKTSITSPVGWKGAIRALSQLG